MVTHRAAHPANSLKNFVQLAVSTALGYNRFHILLIGLVIVLVAVLIQQRRELHEQSSTLDRLQHLQLDQDTAIQGHSEQLICPKPHSTFDTTFLATSEPSMTLADSATKVASRFDYGRVDINIGVQEFLKQMGPHVFTVLL